MGCGPVIQCWAPQEPLLPLSYGSQGVGGNQDVFHAAELGCPLGERDSVHFYLRVFSI